MSTARHQGPKPATIVHWIGHLWLRVFGWRLHGQVPEALDRGVFIAAPHTTNWDLPFMLAGAWALDVRLSWLGKHTLFGGLGGVALRWLGGVAVDRSAPHGLVAQAAQRIRDANKGMWLAVPPEGTRSWRPNWKSGFYHMAVEANAPILFGFLDFKTKRVGVLGTLHPTGDIDADMETIREAYADIVGKFPEHQGPVALAESRDVVAAD